MSQRLRFVMCVAVLGLAFSGSGCSGVFTSQVRRAGLRYEIVPAQPGSPRDGQNGAPAGYEVRARRTAGGRVAQIFLPVAWVLDAVVSVGEVAGMVTTVAGWQKAIP